MSAPELTPGDVDGPEWAEYRRLLSQGVKLKTYQPLVVVCQHSRLLVSVLRLNGQRMLAYDGIEERVRVTTSSGRGKPPTETEERISLAFGDYWHLDHLDGAAPGAFIGASNKCCARRIQVDWIEAQLAAGVRRVVAPVTD